MSKVLTIIGARPQFIKASVVSKAIRDFSSVDEILLHTGQHFDSNMSDVFFEQLSIPRPDIQLDIHGGRHGAMTGRMLEKIESAILDIQPDRVMVYGDTNSTLAGALAAAKLHVPVAHVEAGLRSFNMLMPEEINRILTDNISDLLFCPTEKSVENLSAEGFLRRDVKISKVGDVMQDSAMLFSQSAVPPPGLRHKEGFIIATLHRAENTDSSIRLAEIVSALNRMHLEIAPVLLPLHPRTKAALERQGLRLQVDTIDPVGYFEMLWLLQRCGLVVTDSGGVQKEAFFFGKTCITIREQTEWVELVDAGVNFVVGSSCEMITQHARDNFGREVKDECQLYGGGKASGRIVEELFKA